MTPVDTIDVVVAHSERVTLRVGEVFVKIDSDAARLAREAEVMHRVPVPTPTIRWHNPPALALAALPGVALGKFGEPSPVSRDAWVAAGAAIRTLHDAPLPPWPGATVDALAARLDEECAWLLANDVLPTDIVSRNRRRAETALRPWTPAFIHGDLQPDHVFVDGDTVTGIIDWSEAAPGDSFYDLAILTLGHPEHLDDVIAGYGRDVDREKIDAWWSWRCLIAVRWLVTHGYGDPATFPEVALLRRA
jgi:aminoglycoside phosphotransferase (APT) family kinase protein